MNDGNIRALTTALPPFESTTERKFVAPLIRLWKGPTKVSGPVSTNKITGLVRDIDPPSSTAVYDTGSLVFWTSWAKIQSWSTDIENANMTMDIHTGNRISSIDINIPNRTRKEIFGEWDGVERPSLREVNKSTPFDPISIPGSKVLDYIVVSEHYLTDWERGTFSADAYGCWDGVVREPRLNLLIIKWIDQDQGIA